MWATIGAESSDAFDAISRSYAYTFQRPMHYFCYVLVAALLGSLGWLLLWGFTESIITLSYWGTSWGTGAERLGEIVAATGPDSAADSTAPTPSTTLWLGSALIGLCVGIVRAVASGVSFSYFWCVAAAVYLLLRRDTDQTEMDDIVVEDEEDIPYGLPPLETDAAGVPGVSSEEVDEESAGSVADHVP